MPTIPKLPAEIDIRNAALGTLSSSSAGVYATADAVVTAQIVGDIAGVFRIAKIETLDVVSEPDGPHGSVSVLELALVVNGPGPIQVDAGQAILVFVEFSCPPDPKNAVFRASVILQGIASQAHSGIPIFATANLGRLDIANTSNPLILPGQTENFEFQIISSLGHQVGGAFKCDSAFNPHFSSDPQFPTISAGATSNVTIPVTCAPGTSAGIYSVLFRLRAVDNSEEYGDITISVTVTRSATVTASLPGAFTLGQGESVRCVIKAIVTGGPATFAYFAVAPLPNGLSVSPGSQSVDVDGSVTVALDISIDRRVPVGLLSPLTLFWTVREPEITGTLVFNITVIDTLPHAMLFSSGTLGPSTVTADATWTLTDTGNWSFEGRIHESGVIGHAYGFGMTLTVEDENGVPFDLAAVRSGSVGPDLPFGHNDDSWSGNDGYIGFDQRIADNWAAIVSARARSGLNVDSNVLLAILDALAIPAIAVLAAFGPGEAKHWHCTGPRLVPAGDNNGAGVGAEWQCHRDDDGQ